MGRDVWFATQAECLSLLPGRLGLGTRAAFYHLTLARCPLDVAIEFGALLTHSQAELGHRVYIGVRTMLGWVSIGDDTLLADNVQVLSGARHHLEPGNEVGGARRQHHPTRLERLAIGRNCWIGAHAVVMADIGDDSIIGAGSVVTRPRKSVV